MEACLAVRGTSCFVQVSLQKDHMRGGGDELEKRYQRPRSPTPLNASSTRLSRVKLPPRAYRPLFVRVFQSIVSWAVKATGFHDGRDGGQDE